MSSVGAPIRIDVLGPLTVHRPDPNGGAVETLTGAGIGSRLGRILLARLAVAGGSPVTHDALVDVLWPEAQPREADRVLASLVSRLRSRLGREVVQGDSHAYAVGAGPAVDVDLVRAAGFVREAETRQAAGEPGTAAATADQGLRLLQRGPAAVESASDWAEEARREQAAMLRRARLVASAALARSGATARALSIAAEAVDDDPLDEEATHAVLRAHHAAGNTAAALTAYETLRRSLAEALGADPSPQTAALHEALLRGDSLPVAPSPAPGPGRPAEASAGPAGLPFVGRETEVARLTRSWDRAAAGRGAIVLVAGEAGVGKTRLAGEAVALARRTGGLVLSGRCYEAERSLLLQPLSEALDGAVAGLPHEVVRAAAAGHEERLAAVVPALGQLVHLDTGAVGDRVSLQAELARTFTAVSAFIAALSRHGPVLLFLDDLQNAASLTVDCIHHLRRIVAHFPVLVVATLRASEGAAALRTLADVAERVDLGPLAPTDVDELARAAGHGDRAAEISRRTGGHALYVTQVLEDLATGGEGRPASLRTAVLDRLRRCGPDAGVVLRGGAVLGATFDPLLAARLVAQPLDVALSACEAGLGAGLLTVRGGQYEFANDLIRDAVHDAIPEPTRLAYHRAAADLLVDRPEAVARHAAACGDWLRACRSWLVAAEAALGRFAAADAMALADQAHEVADRLDNPELVGRSLVARGLGREATLDYTGAEEDFRAAVQAGRRAGDHRLEMAAMRALAGEWSLDRSVTVAELERPAQDLLRLARSLGDRVAEADALDRLAVLCVSRLDFVSAAAYADQAGLVAEMAHDEQATAYALDARKNQLAYLGLVEPLAPVVARLEPILRRHGELWWLQWTVFESSFVALAAEDHVAALDRMNEALAINRRSGYVGQESWFLAHIGWLHRLAGDREAALEVGRTAVEHGREHGGHRWWLTTAVSLYAGTLLSDGRSAEAAELLAGIRPHGPAVGDESYRLRVLAPLAEATGDRSVLAEADDLLGALVAPPGAAWLLGADVYLSLGRAWLAAGDPGRAEAILRPFAQAATRAGWPALVRLAASIASPPPVRRPSSPALASRGATPLQRGCNSSADAHP